MNYMIIHNVYSMKIAYSCNDHYIQQTGISMISVMENNQDVEHLILYFISKNCSPQNISILKEICNSYNRELIIIDFDDIAYDLSISNTGRHIETIYAKIFFTRIPSLDKVIYLDSDIIVTGSLKELWDTDLSGYYLGAVQTFTNSKSLLGIPDNRPFFNDGMVIMNVDLCRKSNLIQDCLNLINKFDGNPPVLSEGVLNKVCMDKVKYISIKYNLLSGILYYGQLDLSYLCSELTEYDRDDIQVSINTPVCIHYLTGFYNRPWYTPCTHPYKSEYLNYKKLSPWANQASIYKSLPIRIKIINLCYRFLGCQITNFIRKLNSTNVG